MPLRSLKLKWAWQAQFLSHTLQILKKVIFFEDLQMVLLSFLKIFIVTKVTKSAPSLSVQEWRSLWLESVFVCTSLAQDKEKLINEKFEILQILDFQEFFEFLKIFEV